MRLRSLALGLPLLAVLAGCGAVPDEPDDGALGAASEAIQGGYDDATDTSVVAIAWMSGGYFGACTGSLIAPNLVLTAHHCVAETLAGAQGVVCGQTYFAKPDAASNFWVTTKQFMGYDVDDYHMVSEVIVPDDTSFCGNDVAFLVLEDNIQPSETIPIPPRVDVEIAKHEKYSAVGYGGTVQNGSGAGQRRRLDDLTVICLGAKCYMPDQITETEWFGDHGICEGDSGGPALDAQGRVIGVTSRGGTDATMTQCLTPIYGYVYPWADWIKATATHAATVGGYDPAPWVNGWPTDPAYGFPIEATDDPTTCASGKSLSDSKGAYCTRLCQDSAPCPEGSTCTAVEGEQLCQRDPEASGTGGGGAGPTDNPEDKSGCSVHAADPTKPVPWRVGAALAALVLLRRRLRGPHVGR